MAAGDQDALAALYDQTSRLVFGLTLRVLRDRATAEEVLLDVYKQAWRQASLYDERRGTPTGWLLKIAHSRAVDRVRVIRREREVEKAIAEGADAGVGVDPEEATVLSEQRRLVRSALASLPPEQREVLQLAYYAGMSQTEIASRLDLPLGTVKTRVRLGMAKMRDLLVPSTKEVP
jgi:RNA polymerase sigma-70 factor (ECF subfamily)